MTKHKKIKLFQSSKNVAGLRRRIYVSWLDPDAVRNQWKDNFWRRIAAEMVQAEDVFAPPLQTDPEPGTLNTECAAVKELLHGQGVTDVVAVLTDTYVVENSGAASRGELACFIDERSRMVRPVTAGGRAMTVDSKDKLRIFVAPVDQMKWTYRVRQVALGELVRLREHRFTWPSEAVARCADEIFEAVEFIINKPED